MGVSIRKVREPRKGESFFKGFIYHEGGLSTERGKIENFPAEQRPQGDHNGHGETHAKVISKLLSIVLGYIPLGARGPTLFTWLEWMKDRGIPETEIQKIVQNLEVKLNG